MRKLHIYVFLLLAFAMNICARELPVKTILVMGDSLSAGYGIDVQQGWVALLERELKKTHNIKMVNASVSGETTSGGNLRLAPLLKEHQPDIVILELGGNDALRGQPVKLIEKNLQAMIDASKQSGATVILAGMQIPPNYGPRYTGQFKNVYPTLAQKNDIALIDFLLEGVGGNAKFMQRDGIHPTAEAQSRIAENVMPVVEKTLAQLQKTN